MASRSGKAQDDVSGHAFLWWPQRRDVALDAVVAAASVVESVWSCQSWVFLSGTSRSPLLVGGSFAFGALLLLRRRFPLTVAVLAVVGGALRADGAVIVQQVALYSAGVYTRSRRALAVVTGLLLLLLAQPWYLGPGLRPHFVGVSLSRLAG